MLGRRWKPSAPVLHLQLVLYPSIMPHLRHVGTRGDLQISRVNIFAAAAIDARRLSRRSNNCSARLHFGGGGGRGAPPPPQQALNPFGGKRSEPPPSSG